MREFFWYDGGNGLSKKGYSAGCGEGFGGEVWLRCSFGFDSAPAGSQ
jgi:hypothetical protein